jgi:xanthine dehydrogenase accessory factor
MAFANALWDGHAELDGVSAVRTEDVKSLRQILYTHQNIPITSLALETLRESIPWDVLINALMRKRDIPDDWRGVARQTIGLGVGFVPGCNCDVAIETSWEDLGRIVTEGRTLPLRGEPRLIAGVGRERNVYSPHSGIVTTKFRIGDIVTVGESVLSVGPTALRAPLTGAIRGLVREGVTVANGSRVLEIEPRGERQLCFRRAERPMRVAEAVKSLCMVNANGVG